MTDSGRIRRLLDRHRIRGHASIDEVARTVDAMFADRELRLESEAVACELSDAMDDLNDSMRSFEGILRARRVRPGWIPMPDRIGPGRRRRKGAALLWDGSVLRYDNGRGPAASPLLSVSKEIRVEAASLLPALWRELRRRNAG